MEAKATTPAALEELRSSTCPGRRVDSWNEEGSSRQRAEIATVQQAHGPAGKRGEDHKLVQLRKEHTLRSCGNGARLSWEINWLEEKHTEMEAATCIWKWRQRHLQQIMAALSLQSRFLF
ncbi:hypothetical protein LR48_Vigan27s002000 [Vigna angularis]|uniref:Uncharacterized protein n=1 Tax=Phaseolus angularis TaxID=3914 RepID=A0A0L9T2Z5_PHAAN|nr:hypothetical protein LR48_Vigan27s002000 [Vigna angularis]